MKLLRWRGRMSKANFRDQFVSAVHERYPDVEAKVDGELGVVITGLPNGAVHRTWLDRAYQEFVKNPAGIDELFDRWMGSLRDLKVDGLDLSNIVPMIKDQSWVAAQLPAAREADPDARLDQWIEDYNSELVIAYAEFGESIRFLDRKNVQESGQSEDDLRQIAIENLRRRTAQREVYGDNGRYWIGAGGNLEASLLLDDELWADPRLSVRGDLIVGVPDRDTLVVVGSEDLDQVLEAAAMVERLHRTERYPISEKLFIRRGDRFELLDIGAVDDSHPIPNLDVIDVFGVKKGGGATLVIAIASPFAADARSVYRLFRKLNGYLRYVGSAEFEAECGKATPDNTTVELKFHPKSDAHVVELFGSLSGWTAQRGAALDIQWLPSEAT